MSKRVKNCTFVLYPETGFELGKLEEHFRRAGYKACISPLHSPDKEVCGEKKNHYHVIVALDSPRDVVSLSSEFQAVCDCHSTSCFNVGNMGSLNRYLTHEDNPEKEQFIEKPRCFGGYPYDKYVFRKLTEADTFDVMARLFSYISDGAYDYSSLIRICTANADYPMIEWCVSHAYAVNCILNGSHKNNLKEVKNK